ncbi:MAG: HTH and integrase core domain protein [Hyperionvirus sp.]|uniref:HTH and integrase core domain protein n=1 Tax=Hyperionvirus sp. TaxID=2487770 RepID=A0A3G5AD94_9VIRU|nr:MAG: HTH and integrase core domain protein [Hyperionvirus sp.]
MILIYLIDHVVRNLFARKNLKSLPLYLTIYAIMLRKKFISTLSYSLNISKENYVTISKSYIYYILNKNDITHKRICEKIIPKNKDKFNAHILELNNIIATTDRDTLISVDESSILIGQKPHYGWSPCGQDCIVESMPHQTRYSLILSVNRSRIISYKLIRGAVNGEIFMDYIVNDVMPNSDGGSILIIWIMLAYIIIRN